ncbi:hypothetical protein BSKO_00204 [Bryopsis sp. KO-2023]|nr:hypothetical protein BSKO_00204 [Bryopsis sp. KO-2023]
MPFRDIATETIVARAGRVERKAVEDIKNEVDGPTRGRSSNRVLLAELAEQHFVISPSGDPSSCLLSTIRPKNVSGREVIAEEGGTKVLVELLDSADNDGFLEEVVLAVANLAFNNDNRVSMAADGCIKSLIKLLSSENKNVAKDASQALANLAYNDEINERITREGGVSVLMGLLQVDDPAAEEAARAIANLARNTSSKEVIVNHGGIDALIKLLPDTNVNCKRNAALALANIASGNDENKVSIASAGGIKKLIPLLTEGNEASKKNAAPALANLADKNMENQAAISAFGGIAEVWS